MSLTKSGEPLKKKKAAAAAEADIPTGLDETNNLVFNCLWTRAVSRSRKQFQLTASKKMEVSVTQLQGNDLCQQPLSLEGKLKPQQTSGFS